MEENMSTRNAAIGVWVIVFSGLLSSCSNTTQIPTAPVNTIVNGHISASTLSSSNLQITSVSLSDGGQGTSGQWLYDAGVSLYAGGVSVTVTSVQVQLLMSSQVLATTSITPMLFVPANSSREAALLLQSTTHVDVSALTAHVTVYFSDAYGHTGSVTATWSCFGCWDY
jgi:hypothetical protein